jgi:hypothetical protein
MHKDFDKLLTNLKPVEPPDGLFERVTLAIQKEQQRQKQRKWLFCLFFALVALFALPFSSFLLANQIKESGVFYFFASLFMDWNLLLAFGKEYLLAILESLPITGLMLFLGNLVFILFAWRILITNKTYALTFRR